MGIATFLVALVPGYEPIGIWGGVLLTVLRFIQGIGVGGEWGGSVLLSMEWAQSNRHRGFIASWPQFGVPAGLFLSNLAVLAMSAVSGEQFLTWGWRVPFLFSIVLVALGLYIRLGIQETPVFVRLVAERRIERAPVLEVLRRQPREIILTALCRMAEQAPFYLFTAFVFAYGTERVAPRSQLSSDGSARRRDDLVRLYSVLWAFVRPALDANECTCSARLSLGSMALPISRCSIRRVPWLVVLAIVFSLVPHDMMYGPQAALIAESFTGRLRYSGASLGYQLSSLIAGGPAPLIASWLLSRYHSATAIAVFIFGCAIISLLATAMLKDHTNKDIYDD